MKYESLGVGRPLAEVPVNTELYSMQQLQRGWLMTSEQENNAPFPKPRGLRQGRTERGGATH